MSVKIVCIGKTSESYLKEGMNVYLKRLTRYGNIQWIELPDVPKKKFNSQTTLKYQEFLLFQKEFQPGDCVVGLDEKGGSYGSHSFAQFWNTLVTGNSNVIVLIGGAYGYHDELYSRMNNRISLSQMTFSHQLVRLLFLEQLYRAHTILRGEPYHND